MTIFLHEYLPILIFIFIGLGIAIGMTLLSFIAGESIQIAASKQPKFRPGKSLKESVNK